MNQNQTGIKCVDCGHRSAGLLFPIFLWKTITGLMYACGTCGSFFIRHLSKSNIQESVTSSGPAPEPPQEFE